MLLWTCNNEAPIVLHQGTLIHITVCSFDIEMVLITFDVNGILISKKLPLFVDTNIKFLLLINTNTMLHILFPCIFDLQWPLLENHQQAGQSQFDKLST